MAFMSIASFSVSGLMDGGKSPFRGCRLAADGVMRCRRYRKYRQTNIKNGGVLREEWHCMEPVTLHIAYIEHRTGVLEGSGSAGMAHRASFGKLPALAPCHECSTRDARLQLCLQL